MSKNRTVEPRGPEYEIFGSNLANARKAHGYSQAELASHLGMTQSTYAGWETGTRKIQLSSIIQVANFLGVSIDMLIGTKKLVFTETQKDDSEFIEANKDNTLYDDPKIEKIVNKANKLNSEGLSKLNEYADDLLSSGKYAKVKIDERAI